MVYIAVSRRFNINKSGRIVMNTRQWWLVNLWVVFALVVQESWGGSSTSSIAICISDGASSQRFFLTDTIRPLPGQAVVLDEYTSGKLMLSGGFLPNPKITITSANKKHSATDTVDWNEKGQLQFSEYFRTLERLQQKIPLSSSSHLSVVPIGLAGSSSSDESSMAALPESRQSDEFNILSWFFARPTVPRLWPTLQAAMYRASSNQERNTSPEGSKTKEDQPGAHQHLHTSSHVIRFMVSLHRFRVQVIDEEDHYVHSSTLIRERKQARDPHPDLREGQLRADLPKAYIGEVDYGHRLVVSVNITLTLDLAKHPHTLLNEDRIGVSVMRMVTRDMRLDRFEAMFPNASIFARFRWDLDLPAPLEAIDYMQRDKLLAWADDDNQPLAAAGGGAARPWNATLMTCPPGSYRRSRHGRFDTAAAAAAGAGARPCGGGGATRATEPLPQCPLAEEWPTRANPKGSWIMRRGGAAELKARVEQWRLAMTHSDRLAAHAVPLAIHVRRAPSPAEIAQLQEEQATLARFLPQNQSTIANTAGGAAASAAAAGGAASTGDAAAAASPPPAAESAAGGKGGAGADGGAGSAAGEAGADGEDAAAAAAALEAALNEASRAAAEARVGWLRNALRDRRAVSYAHSRCLRTSAVPLALMMAMGDLAVLLLLTLLVLLAGWLYLAAGFLLARLSAHVRLPPFVSVHAVPLRLHFITLGAPQHHT